MPRTKKQPDKTDKTEVVEDQEGHQEDLHEVGLTEEDHHLVEGHHIEICHLQEVVPHLDVAPWHQKEKGHMVVAMIVMIDPLQIVECLHQSVVDTHHIEIMTVVVMTVNVKDHQVMEVKEGMGISTHHQIEVIQLVEVTVVMGRHHQVIVMEVNDTVAAVTGIHLVIVVVMTGGVLTVVVVIEDMVYLIVVMVLAVVVVLLMVNALDMDHHLKEALLEVEGQDSVLLVEAILLEVCVICYQAVIFTGQMFYL